MAFEHLPDSSGNTGQELSDVEHILQGILLSNNARVTATGFGEHLKWSEGTSLSLMTDQPGNILALRVKGEDPREASASGWIQFGYYSPIYNEFVGIPELVSPEEMGILASHAEIARYQAVEGFNRFAQPTETRIDYSHNQVQSFHIKQQRMLHKNDFAERIFRRHNYGDGNGLLYIDEFTTVSVCLLPLETRSLGKKQIMPGRDLAFRLWGAEVEQNGHEVRLLTKVIPVATRPPALPEYDSVDNFVIRTAPGEGWITEDELNILKAMAIELQTKEFEMELEGLDFDIENLGLKVKPQRPVAIDENHQETSAHLPDFMD